MKGKSVLWVCALALLSCVLAIYISAAYNVPEQVSMDGDGLLGEMLVKSIQENGPMGNLFNNRLGAPDRSTLIETPFLDWIYVFEVWIIGFFVDNPGMISIVFYCIGYILAALTMFFLLRRLRMGYGSSFVFSLLFSFSTYHSFRGIGHGTLSNYFMVPLAVFLAIYMAVDGVDEDVLEGFKNKRLERLLCCAMALLLGFTNIYFAAFGLVIMVIAFLYRIIRTKLSKKEWKYLLYPLLTIGGVGVSLLPKVLFTIRHGGNELAVTRSPLEAEIYGLKLIQMLFPAPFSKLESWTGLNHRYMEGNPYITENYLAAIGFISVVGFFILCGYLIKAVVNREKNKNTLLSFSSLAVLTCVLVATVGGFGMIFNLLVLGEIRCYNRITIYIICFCLIAVAAVLRDFVHKKQITAGILLLLLGIGWIDQVNVWPSDYWKEAAVGAENCQEFYGEIEDTLEENAMVYQLPFMQFPEIPDRNKMSCYKQLSAYVFTDTIRWSHGGMKGRNMQAQELYRDEGMSREFVQGIRERGFEGVCIDLSGYAEEEQQRVLEFYSENLGLMPIVSEDEMLYFYDLRDLKQ